MADEAQIDTGNAGGKTEDAANDLLGNPDNDKAVLLYGVISLSSALISILLFILLNNKYYIASSSQYFLSHVATFLPIGMGWVMISIFDGEFMREVFSDLAWLSILGPFFYHWYATVSFIIAMQNGGAKWTSGKVTGYDELWFWLTWVFQAALTIAEMILQVVLLPRVFDWVDEAEILDNGAENQEALFVF